MGLRCSLGFKTGHVTPSNAPHQPSAPCRKPHHSAFLAPAVRTLSVVLDIDQTGNLLGFKHHVRRRADLSPTASISSSLRCFPPFSSLLHVDYLSVPSLPAYTGPCQEPGNCGTILLLYFPRMFLSQTLAHPPFCFRSRACEATLTHFPSIFRSVCVLVRQPRPALHFSFHRLPFAKSFPKPVPPTDSRPQLRVALHSSGPRLLLSSFHIPSNLCMGLQSTLYYQLVHRFRLIDSIEKYKMLGAPYIGQSSQHRIAYYWQITITNPFQSLELES